MDGFKNDVFDIIKSITGHQNIITVNVAFVDFVEDLEVGLFLSQLIYWSDKGAREDGFIFKTDNEWHQELRLSKYALRKSRKRLEEMNLLSMTQQNRALSCCNHQMLLAGAVYAV